VAQNGNSELAAAFEMMPEPALAESETAKAQIEQSRPARMRRLCALLVGVMAILAIPVFAGAASLSPEESVGHVGETATVCGLVVSATYLPRAPQAPTFLDLGKPYPDQIFSAIIFGSDRPKFGAPETWMRGRSVCVTGDIFLYEGKPKIILHDPKQLSGAAK
jgi:hypothetical protein